MIVNKFCKYVVLWSGKYSNCDKYVVISWISGKYIVNIVYLVNLVNVVNIVNVANILKSPQLRTMNSRFPVWISRNVGYSTLAGTAHALDRANVKLHL